MRRGPGSTRIVPAILTPKCMPIEQHFPRAFTHKSPLPPGQQHLLLLLVIYTKHTEPNVAAGLKPAPPEADFPNGVKKC